MKQLMETVKLTRGSEFNEMQVEELALLYQETNDDRYLESILFNVFPFIIQKCNRYMTLNEEDKTSVALEKLYVALTKWKPGKGKFLTLYGTMLNNELVCMLEATMTQKAQVYKDSTSLEYLSEEGFQPSTMDKPFELSAFVLDCKLNKEESRFVELMFLGYTVKELCQEIGKSRREYDDILNGVRIKIKNNYTGTISLNFPV